MVRFAVHLLPSFLNGAGQLLAETVMAMRAKMKMPRTAVWFLALNPLLMPGGFFLPVDAVATSGIDFGKIVARQAHFEAHQ
uniref:RH74240p n=1 Tax=Drosophila melanogaster TaxID=7227 RepID=Q8MYR9_DROME|nr:RH74240p [Drosophila melanogaster]